ncbi:MAG: extracellular solute-binding protein [Clostridiales bacterium]|nr:extracellular solute-binding protein [Clostridiales bacterium]
MNKYGKKFLLSALFPIILGACATTTNPSSSQMPAAAGTEEPSASSQRNEPVNLEMYTWWTGADQEMCQAVFDAFNEERSAIKVTVNFIPYDNYSSKLNTSMAADKAPDIFLLQEYLANEWGEKGVSMDLNPLYAEAGQSPAEIYVDSALFTTNGKLWGVSPNMCTILMYYNKELLENAGIDAPTADASKPWTWEEYVAAARKMTTDTSGKHPGEDGFNKDSIQTYGTLTPTSSLALSSLLYSNGVGFANADGMELEIVSDNAVNVLQSVADLSLLEYVAPSIASAKSLPQSPAMLMNGQLAMMIDGSWQAGEFSKENYDVGIAATPMFAAPAGIAWSSALVMSAKTQSPKEAFEALSYMLDYNKVIEICAPLNIGVGNLPNLIASYENADQKAAWSKYYNTDLGNVTTNLMTNIARLGECVTLKGYGEIVEQIIIPELDRLWLGEVDAKEAVAGAEANAAGKLNGVWK